VCKKWIAPGVAKSLSLDVNPAIAKIAIFRWFYDICVFLPFQSKIKPISFLLRYKRFLMILLIPGVVGRVKMYQIGEIRLVLQTFSTPWFLSISSSSWMAEIDLIMGRLRNLILLYFPVVFWSFWSFRQVKNLVFIKKSIGKVWKIEKSDLGKFKGFETSENCWFAGVQFCL